jgi:DinB superfamily
MSDHVAWALGRAREQTLALVADVPAAAMQRQSVPGERHPAWLLGHLLLADSYLLFLLDARPLPDDFPQLIEQYGPASAPAPAGDAHAHTKDELVGRLTATDAARVARVLTMDAEALARPLPDAHLARAQPTIGHHLLGLVFHEGYHSGQLAAWRKAHGFAPARWTSGPQG